MRCQRAEPTVVAGHEPTGLKTVVALLLCAGASVRPGLPPLRAQTAAPDITVVANPALRPTAVLLPHFQFWVAVDTAAGGLVLRDLTINPVTFTGWVRIEGIQPGSREAERRMFADSVRFSADGRVALLVSDSATRAPITIEPVGVRGAAAGKLVVTASHWPVGRAFLVTIDPADLYEQRWRSVGYGVRDRLRIDDARHMVFLQDSSVARTVIAIGFGQGVGGAIRLEQTSIVLRSQFGAETGRERRNLARLVLSLQDHMPLWATLEERVDQVGHCANPAIFQSGVYREVLLFRISEAEFRAGAQK